MEKVRKSETYERKQKRFDQEEKDIWSNETKKKSQNKLRKGEGKGEYEAQIAKTKEEMT